MSGRGTSRRRLTALPGGGRRSEAGAGRAELHAVRGRPGVQGPQPGRGRRRVLLWFLLALAAAAVATLLYVTARDGLQATARLSAVPVRRGLLELAFRTEAVLVRDEAVQVAASGGTLDKLTPEGQVVRVGTPVVKVGGVAVAAQRPGLVSYQVDGLEAELAPGQLPWLRGGGAGDGPAHAWFKGLPPRRAEAAGTGVDAGQPLFKVLNAARLWLLISLPADPVAQVVAINDRPRVTLTALGGAELRFEVTYKSKTEDGQVVMGLLADSAFPDALLYPRRTPIRIVLDRHEGIIVPEAALTVEGGRLGVRVDAPGGRRFVPVELLGRGGTAEAAVKGDLKEGDAVLVPAGSVAGAKSLQQ